MGTCPRFLNGDNDNMLILFFYRLPGARWREKSSQLEKALVAYSKLEIEYGPVSKQSPVLSLHTISAERMTDSVWKIGTYYRDRRAGCFQDYVVVPEHTVTHIPENMSFESAACLGVCGLTAAMTLWKWLDVDVGPPTLSPPPSPGCEEYILIWGGSSITGQFAIQLAAQSGLNVIAVTSKKNRELMTKLGATHVVTRDGKTGDELIEEIRELGRNRITRGIDLAGAETVDLAIRCLSTDRRALFAPVALMSSRQVVPKNVSVRHIEMKQFVLDPSTSVYAEYLTRAIASGRIRLPVVEVLQGGLDVVPEGLDRLKKGLMNGRKLVVSMR